MTYPSLVCILRSAQGQMAHLDHAIALARTFDAHLDVLCLGIDRVQVGFYYAGATTLLEESSLAQAEADANAVTEAARARLEPSGIRWATDTLVVQWGAISPAVALAARHADMCILPHPYGGDSGPEDEAITEAALFGAPVPVLSVPHGWNAEGWATEPVIATNQGPEAMNAVRAAMPGLTIPGKARIVIVDPPQHGPQRTDPGGALSVYLARHKVKSEVTILARTMPRIADVVIRHIKDSRADLVVMGAYGHSRLREAMLGGPTRDMLEDCPVPILMAH